MTLTILFGLFVLFHRRCQLNRYLEKVDDLKAAGVRATVFANVTSHHDDKQYNVTARAFFFDKYVSIYLNFFAPSPFPLARWMK